MISKKTTGIICGVLLIIGLFIAYKMKPMTMNDINDKPNFAGVVKEVYDNSILISVNEDEQEYKSSDLIRVSLDVKLEDSMTNINVGEKVRVYYDGAIQESYPAQINTVYAITLIK